MIVFAIFIIFCIWFYKIYLDYGIIIIIYFQIFCLIYFWLINYIQKEINKSD